MPLLTAGASLQLILDHQYYLAKNANISLSDSNRLPEFEREFFISNLKKDLTKQTNLFS